MAKPSDQIIKCGVKSCKFNDKTKYCTLSDITVGQTCYCATEKAQTDCMNFQIDMKEI